mmetsp:Transcript_30802/g.98163  ORF Transcript_30802/g.98163 Transcript_30802/m.98163 type:complete len:1007 (+) Transcript_30802:181-3201(+)
MPLHGVLGLRVPGVRRRVDGVRGVRRPEAVGLAEVGVAEGHVRLGHVPRVGVDGHAEARLRQRRVELRLVGLPHGAARADGVAHARLAGEEAGLLDRGDAAARAAGDGGARAAHLRARAGGRGGRRRAGARAGRGGVGRVALLQRALPGVELVLHRAAVLHAALVVDGPDGPRHAVDQRARVDLVVARELADVHGAPVRGVQLAEERVEVGAGGRDLVPLAGAAEVGDGDVAVVVEVQALEDLGGLDLAAVGVLDLRDGLAQRLHHVARLPVVLVARRLIPGRPLARRPVAPELAVEAVVHDLDGLLLVRGPVDARDEGVHVHLVVPVHALRGHVGLHVCVHELQAGRPFVVAERRVAVRPLLPRRQLLGHGPPAAASAPFPVGRRPGVRLEREHVRGPGLRPHGRGVERLLRRQGLLAAGAVELAHQQVHQLVLVHHLPVPQQLPQPVLRDPLGQRPLHAAGLGADVLHKVLREERRVPRPVRQPVLPVHEAVRDDGHVVVGVLVRPVEVHVRQAAAGDGGRALEEVVLALAALHAARRRSAVLVGEVGELAHEAAPVDAPLVRALRGLARELRGPEEVDGLARDVVAGGAQRVGELLLAHDVAPLRVQLAEGLAELVAVLQEAVHQRLRDVAHVALLGLVARAADVHAAAVDEVAELLEGRRALAVLVHGLHEELALALADPDAHLVEDLHQVLGEDEARLRQRAVPEDAHEPGAARVALANDLPQPLHPRHGVAALGRRVEEVGQVHRPDLEVVARLLPHGVDEAAAGVVLLVVVGQRVPRMPRVRLGRGHVLRPAHRAHEPVLALDVSLDLVRLRVVPHPPLLLLQRGPLVGRVLVPVFGVPARRRLVALLPGLPRLVVHARAVLAHRRNGGHLAGRRRAVQRGGGLRQGLGLARLAQRLLGVRVGLAEGLARAGRREVHVARAAGGDDRHVRVRLEVHLPRQRGPHGGIEVDRALRGLPVLRPVRGARAVDPLLPGPHGSRPRRPGAARRGPCGGLGLAAA